MNQLFFQGARTDFMKKLSGRQVLKDSWVRVKSFTHIFPLVPSSPREVALQSTRLWGPLKVTAESWRLSFRDHGQAELA